MAKYLSFTDSTDSIEIPCLSPEACFKFKAYSNASDLDHKSRGGLRKGSDLLDRSIDQLVYTLRRRVSLWGSVYIFLEVPIGMFSLPLCTSAVVSAQWAHRPAEIPWNLTTKPWNWPNDAFCIFSQMIDERTYYVSSVPQKSFCWISHMRSFMAVAPNVCSREVGAFTLTPLIYTYVPSHSLLHTPPSSIEAVLEKVLMWDFKKWLLNDNADIE